MELKEALRLPPGDTSRDGLLYGLSVSARTWCETVTHRKFVKQGWRLGMDFFPGYIDQKLTGSKVSSPFVSGSNALLVGIRYAIELPYPPVRSVTIQYQNVNGSPTVMVAGTDFLVDLDSQPARLMPPFGAMWPVARVTANAVQVDYVLGYAAPVAASMTLGSALIGTGSPAGFVFTAANVGQLISIPGAGAAGGTLNTVILSVNGSGVATARDKAVTAVDVASTTALLVDHGNPGHWELVKQAIKVLVNKWFIEGLPTFDAKTRDAVKAILGPAMDLRF